MWGAHGLNELNGLTNALFNARMTKSDASRGSGGEDNGPVHGRGEAALREKYLSGKYLQAMTLFRGK